MARPKKLPEGSRLVHVTLPGEMLEGLDDWVVELRATVKAGAGIARSDLIRDILQQALDDHRKGKPRSSSPNGKPPAKKPPKPRAAEKGASR